MLSSPLTPLSIDKWLAGRSTLPIRDHQNTTLNRKTGNITFYSKPILLNGPKGEFSIADMHMDILNRVEPDGSPFVTVSTMLFTCSSSSVALNVLPLCLVTVQDMSASHLQGGPRSAGEKGSVASN